MKEPLFCKLKVVSVFATSLLSISLPAFSATLPTEAEMKSRLVSVLDESRIEAEFYPQILSHAGEKMSPQQVADLFSRATEQFLSTMSLRESEMVRVQLVPYIKPFIIALLDGYPEETVEAIQIFNNQQPDETNSKS